MKGRFRIQTLGIKTVCFCAILASIFFAANTRATQSVEGKVFRIGVSAAGFEEINRNDAAAALKAWAATVGKKKQIEGLLDVSLLPGSKKDLHKALSDDSLDGLSVTVAEYMDLGLEAKEVFIPIREQGPEVRYAVIVRNDGEISEPCDLMGSNLVLGQGGLMNLALPWLRTLTEIPADGGGGSAFIEPVSSEKPSKALLQVFFSQADAALVAAEAFDLACELNPQLRKNLKVLAESPSFIISFFIFPPNAKQDRSTAQLEDAILDLHTTPDGMQVLTVFKSNRIEKYPISVLDSTIEFLERYRLLGSVTTTPEEQQ